ncbi:hypothetical protein QQ045_010494 [Rhodiola kirilowii]
MARFSAKKGYVAAEGESSSRGRKRTRTVPEEEVVAEESEDEAVASDDGNDEDGNDEDENEEAAGFEEQADVSESDGAETMYGSNSIILTDPDVLDCSVCYESLKIPVFQCENGHIACDSCCTKLNNKCPSCSFPIGYNRNRAIEKVIESMKVLCRNSKHGCRERLDFNGRKDHEDNCIYSPYRCPIHGCGVIGSFQQLWRHIPDRHSTIVKRFQYNRSLTILLDKNSKFIVLKEEKEGALFILNNSPDYSGNKITVNSIGPILSKTVLSYDLMAIRDIDTLRLLSLVKNHFAQVGGSSSFLIVPHAFFDSNRQLKMELCIRLTNLQ